MSKKGAERRKWFRIDNPLVVQYEVLDEAEMEARIREVRRGGFPPGGLSATLFGMENEIQEKLVHVKQRAPEAAAIMELLNNKINALINVLPLVSGPDSLLEQPLRDGNLSASGIAFANEEQLEAGTNLYLRLVLAPNYYYVEAYARVVRCQARDGEQQEYPFQVAVEFVHISEQLRELLIRYTMNKETQLLRALRMRG